MKTPKYKEQKCPGISESKDLIYSQSKSQENSLVEISELPLNFLQELEWTRILKSAPIKIKETF